VARNSPGYAGSSTGPRTPPGGPAGPPDFGSGGGPELYVDRELLKKHGAQLVEPADRMGVVIDKIKGAESRLTRYGFPPWGDGEIGDQFKAYYDKNAVPVIDSAEDMRQGIYNAADKCGVTSENYDKNEETNMAL